MTTRLPPAFAHMLAHSGPLMAPYAANAMRQHRPPLLNGLTTRPRVATGGHWNYPVLPPLHRTCSAADAAAACSRISSISMAPRYCRSPSVRVTRSCGVAASGHTIFSTTTTAAAAALQVAWRERHEDMGIAVR